MTAFLLDEVERVDFFKRDQITYDLVCCQIAFGDGRVLEWNEDMPDWCGVISLLERLPGFDRDWFESVSQPPFNPSQHLAFARGP